MRKSQTIRTVGNKTISVTLGQTLKCVRGLFSKNEHEEKGPAEEGERGIKVGIWAREMVQLIKPLPTKPDNLSLISGTHMM